MAEWLGSNEALSPVRRAPGIPAPREALRRSSPRRIKAPALRKQINIHTRSSLRSLRSLLEQTENIVTELGYRVSHVNSKRG